MLQTLSGCGDDDPVVPQSSPWEDVAFPNPGIAGFLDVAARGTRVVATGYGYGPQSEPAPLVVQTTSETWEVVTLPALPAATVLFGSALDRAGRAVLVGGTVNQEPVVIDERAGWQARFPAAAGMLNAVVAGQPDTLVAVGTGSGGLAASSVAPGQWNVDRAGFTTPAEKGLVDVAYADGVFVACGWDDADLQPHLRRRVGDSWSELPGPGGVTTPESRIEYHSVWLEPGGGLWLGGTIVDTTGGGEREVARLAHRPANGDWFEIVLPKPDSIQVVNDILRAQDGSLYLACGKTTGRILRHDGMQWHDEGPGMPGQVLALAEAADGTIYAAGFRNTSSSQPGALLRKRNP
jgi:hypothetical protein